MNGLGYQKLGPAPARCVRFPSGHRTYTGRCISDEIAIQNAAAGFKSELKVTRCPGDVQKLRGSRTESHGAPDDNA